MAQGLQAARCVPGPELGKQSPVGCQARGSCQPGVMQTQPARSVWTQAPGAGVTQTGRGLQVESWSLSGLTGPGHCALSSTVPLSPESLLPSAVGRAFSEGPPIIHPFEIRSWSPSSVLAVLSAVPVQLYAVGQVGSFRKTGLT